MMTVTLILVLSEDVAGIKNSLPGKALPGYQNRCMQKVYAFDMLVLASMLPAVFDLQKKVMFIRMAGF